MSADLPVNFLVATLAIVNPLGKVPIWCKLTAELDARARRLLAIFITVTALLLLIGSLLAGRWALRAFEIDLAAFRLAGGLIILLLGIKMLHGNIGMGVSQEEQEGESSLRRAASRYRRMVVPFAMPILAGPGAMSTMILFSERADGWAGLGVMAAVIVTVCLLLLGLLLCAEWVRRAIGDTLLELLTRLSGLLLTAIAMQFLITALGTAFPNWVGPASPLGDDLPATRPAG